jgi:4-hydroxyphenylpyruvate dioxygenase
MTSIKVAIASNSLGKSASGHTLLHKLESAKLHGFDGVEVAIECLEGHAISFPQSSRASRLRAAAADVDRKAQELSLALIALNPFGAYDGLVDPAEVESRLEEAELWCDLCRLMRIPVLQVGTTNILNLQPCQTDLAF